MLHSQRHFLRISLLLYGPSLCKVHAIEFLKSFTMLLVKTCFSFPFRLYPARAAAQCACSSSATPHFMFAARHVHTRCLSALVGVERVWLAGISPTCVCLSFFLNAEGFHHKATGQSLSHNSFCQHGFTPRFAENIPFKKKKSPKRSP